MLTKRQKDALTFISDFQRKNNRTPSLGDVGRHLGGISRGNVANMLDRMELRGVIRRVVGAQIEILRGPRGKQPPFDGAIPIYDAQTREIRGWLA